jgi:hypothetical protein
MESDYLLILRCSSAKRSSLEGRTTPGPGLKRAAAAVSGE